ncbi:pyrimidine 5-nucleotidase [Fistulina hepatica ATCC 64428]|nr:pyrimidine 5-nucleotidase [Fistulina hepatica ATCC 64428]
MASISASAKDDKAIVWFDIDNTLYSASTKVSYFVSLGLDEDEAFELHLNYYRQYGLALRGLVRHHRVDPLDFDAKCDGSLPLEDMIPPNPSLRQLFMDIDRSKARVWAITNAYRPHAERVLRILNLEDQIDGLIFSDYREENFVCKPEAEFYHRALKVANVDDPSKCYFVDDSIVNINAAKALGWGHCVHFCERGQMTKIPDQEEVDGEISNLEQLRHVWPEIFKSVS